MTKEELLQMYPPGTKINPVSKTGHHSPDEYIVPEDRSKLMVSNINRLRCAWFCGMDGYLSYDGAKAFIISKPDNVSENENTISYDIPVDVFLKGLRVRCSHNLMNDVRYKNGLGTIRHFNSWNDLIYVDWDNHDSGWYNVKNKNKPELLLADNKDMKLLIKAKYPVGTKFKRIDPYEIDDSECVVSDSRISKNNLGYILPTGGMVRYVYLHVANKDGNRWAPVISTPTNPKDDVMSPIIIPTLDQLKKMYPVGTRFYPVRGGVVIKGEIYTVKEDWVIGPQQLGTIHDVHNRWFEDNEPGTSMHSGFIWEYKYPEVFAEIIKDNELSVEALSSTQPNILINNSYVQPRNNQIKCIVPRPDIKVSIGYCNRGTGLNGSISKIRLGNSNSDYQKRFSRSQQKS